MTPQARQQHHHERRRRASHRRARWFTRLALGVGLLVLTSVTLYLAVLNPAQVAQVAVDAIEDATGGRASIDHARIELPGVIRIAGLRLTLPDTTGPDGGQLLFVDEAQIQLSWTNLLAGNSPADKIVFERPTIHLTEHVADQQYNFQKLPRKTVTNDSETVDAVPEIFLQDGQVLFGQIEDGQYQRQHRLPVTGRLLHDPHHPGWHVVTLRHPHHQEQGGATVSGRINIEEHAFEARLEGLSLEGPQRAFLPARFREWWDKMRPEGSFPVARVRFHPKADAPWQAEVEVDGLAMKVPYGEGRLDLDKASGRLVFADPEVRIETLTGVIEGMEYQIAGRYSSLSPDAPFTLDIRVDGELEETPDFLPAFPEPVQEQFDRFSPAGRFGATVNIKRDSPGGKIAYAGAMRLFGMRATYHKFVYPLHGITGEITFTNNNIGLKQLSAHGPTGALIQVTGDITNPGPAAESIVTIVATDVPVDDALISALKPGTQKVIRSFFDQSSADRLPHFNGKPWQVGGTIDARVQLFRPAGIGPDRTKRIVDISSDGVSVLFEHWPYPLRVTSGRLVVQPDRLVTIPQIMVESPSGAVGRVWGELLPVSDSHKLRPDLRFAAEDFTIDHTLLASLAPGQARQLRELRLTGTINATGRIFQEPDADEPDFVAHCKLLNGEARPYGGGYALSPVVGQFNLSRSQMVIKDLRASHGPSRLVIDGQIDWPHRKPAPVDADDTVHEDRLASAESASPAPEVSTAPTGTSDPATDAGAATANATPDDSDEYRYAVDAFTLHETHEETANLSDAPAGKRPVRRPRIALDIAASNLDIEPAVLDLVPSHMLDTRTRLLELFDRHKLQGNLDLAMRVEDAGTFASMDAAELAPAEASTIANANANANASAVTTSADDESTATGRVVVEMQPRTLSFVRDGQRIKLNDLQGAITWRDGELHLDKLTGEFNPETRGHFMVSGRLPMDEATAMDIDLDARASKVGPVMRAMLPENLIGILDRLKLDGAYTVENLRLKQHEASGDQPARLELVGKCTFTNAQATLGRVPLTDITGSATLSLTSPEGSDQTHIDLQLQADVLKAYGRHIRDARLHLVSNPQRPETLLVKQLEGKAAEGMMGGRGEINLSDADHEYWLDLSVADASLDAVLYPDRKDFAGRIAHAAEQGEDPIPTKPVIGKVSAMLKLQGTPGDSDSTRGHGHIVVRDAQLYRVPVVVAAMNLANFALPSSDSFNEASILFDVKGNKAIFEKIVLDSPSVQIAGTGSMAIDSTELDVNLITRNPDGPEIWPITNVFNVVKDNLLAIRVTGPLADPDARLAAFRRHDALEAPND